MLQIDLAAGIAGAETTGCAEDPAGVPTCTLPDLAAGASLAVTISGTVDAQFSTSLVTSVTAVLAGDPNPANSEASSAVMVNGSVVEVPTLGRAALVLFAAGLLAGGFARLRRP